MGPFKNSLILSFVLLALFTFLVSCSKNGVAIPKPVPGTPVSDINGNVYKTVVIGTQVWMAENLKVTRYNNGESIPGVKDSTWVSQISGAFCWYNNDSVKNMKTFGALYNWYAVTDPRGLAPQGWHVPSDNDWTVLMNTLGGDSIAATKLKEAGKAHWLSPNSSSTNETGFTALPGGSLYDKGPFTYLGNYGYWWSSTENAPSTAWFRGMYYSLGVFRNNSSKSNGYSVRCVKN